MPLIVENDSRKRFWIGSVVPLALLIGALPLAARLLPGGVGGANGPYHGAPCGAGREVEGCNYVPPTEIRLPEPTQRRVALKVVDRWERECRRRGGLASISPADVERLRRALL